MTAEKGGAMKANGRSGALDVNHTIPTSGDNCARREHWGLSPVGNWADYQVNNNPSEDSDYTDVADLNQDRLHNLVNEIDTDENHANGPDAGAITEGGGQSAWASPKYDARGNGIPVPQFYPPACWAGSPAVVPP